MFQIYNKSSEKISEIKNNSIDLIITSPPFNIGTIYGKYKDNLSFSNYNNMLVGVIRESYRVLKNNGRCIIECADTIMMNGLYIEFAGMVQSICLKNGFSIEKRFFNFAISNNGIELIGHDWDKNYTTKRNTHSNCNQIMVFSKNRFFFNPKTEALYVNYKSSKDHPCPMPNQIYNFFLNKYFKTNYNVLDPFMGTAGLGTEVLKRNGNFFGYELDKKIFQIAKTNLSKTK